MQNTDLGIGTLADLLGLLHDDAGPDPWHARLARCLPDDLDTIDRSATRLGDLCRLRARELFLVAANMAEAKRHDRADILRLLDHAATALEEAEHWSDLATSARHFHQQRARRRHARPIDPGPTR
jgi:hypothetical protein